MYVNILVRKLSNHVFPATGHTTGDVSTSYTMIGACVVTCQSAYSVIGTCASRHS